ncbi:MAG: anthranilate synthase component I, partial [Planctomycetes bacterium]|nr:anthranilate synthase component I [Planctomycetota bacterium]
MIVEALYSTKSGLEISRKIKHLEVEEALDVIRNGISKQAGALFSSGYEYPGRYSRWDIGFFNPPVELVSYGRSFKLLARNKKGQCLLHLLCDIIADHEHISSLEKKENEIHIELKEMDAFFPEEERSRQPSLFTILRTFNEALGSKEDSHLGFFGAFGYDLVFQFDPITFKHPRKNIPDARLFLPDEIIVVDRRLEKAYVLSYDFKLNEQSTEGLSRESQTSSTLHPKESSIKTEYEKGTYAEKVRKVQEGCKRGDYFEVVLSHVMSTPFKGDALEVLNIIQERNPSPYEFVIQLENEQLVGASPEMFVRVEGNMVETCPISGTVARGESPLEDADQIKQLIASPKEEAELTMCTDVDRNDKSRVCKPETVKVLGRRLIEVYSKVIHTVDHVEAELKDGMDGLDAFLSHMWAVTLSGSPKKAAMQAIEDLEESPREWYGGAVGFLCFNGNINTGITIRTVRLKDGLAEVRVGATLLA